MKDRTKGRTALRPAKPAPAAPSRPAATPPKVRSPFSVGGGLSARAEGAGRFIRDTRSELRKVVWPTREEAIRLTLIVILVSVAMGALLGGVDYLFKLFFETLVASL
ncbi:MAG: preprotein translocase subunit SecE [Dehalococcoidales bacterium]|nr:preprotein translocase subunit SecE [Dehalococcoidales bacterium]